MRFDVGFRIASQIATPVQSAELRTFLSQRPGYRNGGKSLISARESTGVYGVWNFPGIDDKPADKVSTVVAFAIDHQRPGFFAHPWTPSSTPC
jgi:hypothetical protein